MEASLLLAVIAGAIVLLFLLLKLRLPAFIALLIASISTGLLSGMSTTQVLQTVQDGMGGTLGFVATVVGLGAIFGGILEQTGGARVIAQRLLHWFGESRAPYAMMITGFLVSIPVFFDVGIIILFPLIQALHRRTGKSLIHYALPLLAGLAVTHACIPPTPGPIAVAEIIGASPGWVILMGVLIGLPMAYCGGILYGRYLGDRLYVTTESVQGEPLVQDDQVPSFTTITAILLTPVVLMVIAAVTDQTYEGNGGFYSAISFVGHPFTALIIANLLAWYLLGRRSGLTVDALTKITTKSLYPAGIIILVTGAGGVYKQTLIDTGAGEMIAMSLQSIGLPIVVFAFLASALIRILQGSATVAMITAGGLVAPLLATYSLSPVQLATLVISISSGATLMSHLNDSGFWLVKEYLQLNEKDGFRTWTAASTIIGLVGGSLATIAFLVLG
jgi:Gnt-I system low-affinity gluconate transporter